jgi:hypothetical protein
MKLKRPRCRNRKRGLFRYTVATMKFIFLRQDNRITGLSG